MIAKWTFYALKNYKDICEATIHWRRLQMAHNVTDIPKLDCTVVTYYIENCFH